MSDVRRRVSSPGPNVAARTAPATRNAIRLIAALAAVGAAFAPGQPTGLVYADLVFRMAFGATVALAGSRAHRSAIIVATGIAAALSTGWALAFSGVALGLCLWAAMLTKRSRLLNTAICALVGNAVLRLSTRGPDALQFHGSTAIGAVIVVLPILISGYRHAHRRSRQTIRKVAAGFAVATAIAGALLVGTVLSARAHINDGLGLSRQALAAARDGNQTLAETELSDATTSLHNAHELLSGWWLAPARLIPGLGYQAQAFDQVSYRALTLSRSADDTMNTGDYHQLKYESGRFNVSLMRRLQNPLRDSVAELHASRAALDGLGGGWLVPPISAKVDEFRHDIDQALPDAALASQAVDVGPGLLGADAPKHYLVLFTTPAEQRALGGFIGAYGELTADGGQVRLTRSGPIADLIEAVPGGTRSIAASTPELQDYVRRYQGSAQADYLQDLTLSPDFPSVAAVAAQLYPQSGGTKVDGVFQLDPFGLAALLQLTGPVHVPELKEALTPSNAARILLVDQYQMFTQSSTRQDLLQSALKATFERLTNGSLPGPKDVSRKLGDAANQGHIMLWSPKANEESFFGRLHTAGALPRPDGGDFLSVRAQNSGHNKIDVFLHRSINSVVGVDPSTGIVTTTVAIKLDNQAPASGLPDYVIGNTDGLPTGSNRLTVEVYTPLDYVSGTIDGQPLAIAPEHELGWHVYSSRLVIPPGGSSTVIMNLRGGVSLRHGYHLRIAPQPGVNPEEHHTLIYATQGWTLDRLLGLRPDGSGASVTAVALQDLTVGSNFTRKR